MKSFLPFDPDQSFLLPPNPRDWLPRDHTVFLVEEAVAELDLRTIYGSYKDGAGAPPFEPRMMVGVLLYAYARGVRSSRRIERLLVEDVSFRVLAGQNQPNFRTICTFRSRHLKALEGLFTQVLVMCRDAGLVSLGHVSVDGTKIRANASKRKAMTLKRMRDDEERLREEVRKMLREAEQTDAEEDEQYGNTRGDELPPELRDKQTRLQKLREAKKKLEERERQDIRENDSRREKEPRENAQYNFTDPESRLMPDSGDKTSYIQAYNAQIAVQADSQIIVAYTLAQNPIDNPQLEHVVHAIERNLGQFPREISADAGYNSTRNLVLLDSLGIEAYISMSKHKRDLNKDKNKPGRPPLNLDPREKMRHKLATPKGKERYSTRKKTVEPVFGQLKEARGFRRFMLRGHEKTTAEWSIACTAHNLLKLFAARGNQRAQTG